jgi:hypothetical protein
MEEPKLEKGVKFVTNYAIGWCILASLVLVGSWGVTLATAKPDSTVKASAPDSRDERVKQLSARIAELEAKPVEHHYELRNEGSRSFRFDPTTGESCIQLATKEDWKHLETQRQSCPYEDFMKEHPDTAIATADCIFASRCSAKP